MIIQVSLLRDGPIRGERASMVVVALVVLLHYLLLLLNQPFVVPGKLLTHLLVLLLGHRRVIALYSRLRLLLHEVRPG